MKEIFNRFNKYDYCFLGLVGVAYYLIIAQYIPCMDDMRYAFDCSDIDNWAWINSFSDALRSQSYDYLYRNGRFAIHTIVQWLCGCGYWHIFFLVSTFSFIALLMGLVYLIRRMSNSSKIYEIPALAIILLLFTPQAGATLFGNMALVINYLWSAAAYIWFIVFN